MYLQNSKLTEHEGINCYAGTKLYLDGNGIYNKKKKKKDGDGMSMTIQCGLVLCYVSTYL